jgi:hypothetical protein
MTKTWFLDNVYERNEEAPYTFYVPSQEVIDSLEKGDIVKLSFILHHLSEEGLNGERMWVEITEIEKDQYYGTLANDPYYIPDLKHGEPISFRQENIIDTEYEDEAGAKWGYYFDTKVMVSDDVLDKQDFNFMVREEPTEEEGDSGWTILSGYETDEYVNNPDNLQFISLGVLLNIDDSILSFINEEPYCAFERNEEGHFYKIDDAEWENGNTKGDASK